MLGKHGFRRFNTSFLEVFSVIQMGVVNILVYNLFPLLNRQSYSDTDSERQTLV